MAYVVKPRVQTFSALRPTSRAMSIKEKTFGTPQRSRSCEPVLQTRFKTPPRTPKSIIAEISGLNDTELEKTENRLKSKLLGQYSNAVKAMKLFDYSQDGSIQKHELRKVLENFCFKMTDSQFERLWVKYDKLNNGSMLNYMDFLNDLGVQPKKKEFISSEINVAQAMTWSSQQKRPSSARHSAPKSPGSRTMPQTPEKNTEQTFRERFLTNYDVIRRAVMKLDHRAIGFVSLSEFKRIIVEFTTQMSDSFFQSLLERCDIKVSHRIHYERFLDYYGEAKTNILWQPEASKAQNDVFTMLRSHVNNNFSSIKDAFLEFDYNKDGKISRNELRRIVEKFSFRLSEEDYSRFMSHVDPEHKGYISYHRFLEIFEKKESKHGHPWLNEKSVPQHVSPPAVMTWTTVEEILRNKIKDNWQSVSSAFIKVDTNRDGFLSRKELYNLLHSYCLPLSDEHFEMLWSLCDENNDGKIGFNEFLRKLGIDIISADLHGHSTKITDESEARERFMKLDQHARLDRGPAQISAEQGLGVLRNHVSQKSTDLRKMFVKFDSNNDGKISRKEFRQVIESLGLTMADDQFDILSANVGFTHGTLSYHNFLKHFQHGRSSVQDRHHFTEQRHDNSSLPEVLFSAEEAEKQLWTKLQRSFSGLREAFYKFDENHDGFITMGEFRRVLKLFMITLKDEEFDKLMKRLQFDKGEGLNYKEFLKRFERRENIDGHVWLMGRSNVRAPKEIGYVSAEEADEIIKKKAVQHWEDISKAFRNFDEDGNGLVTKNEMKNILYRYQLALTQDQFDKLWSRYDTDGNGFVDYKEFIGKLGVEFSPGDLHGHSTRIIEESYDTRMKPGVQDQIQGQHGIVDEKPAGPESQGLTTFEVEKRLKETVMARFYDFVKAFVECDVDRNGSVSRSSLHDIINEHGFLISSQQMNQIWNIFPQNIDGTIHYNDFLSLFSNRKDLSETPETPETPPRSAQKLHTRVRSAPAIMSPKHPAPYGRLSVHGRSTTPTRMTPRIKVLTPPGYAKEIKKRIKEKVHDRWRELEEAFVNRDKEKTGLVKLQQFKDVLFDCNIPLTPDEVRVLWRKHDIHNSASIFYMDFLRSFMEDQVPQPCDKILFRSKLQPTRVLYSPGAKSDQVFALMARLRKQIQNEWKNMRRSFRALDQSGNGTCSILAFRHVLRKYKIELSEEELYHVSTYYDKNLNGRIPYTEFIGAHLEKNMF